MDRLFMMILDLFFTFLTILYFFTTPFIAGILLGLLRLPESLWIFLVIEFLLLLLPFGHKILLILKPKET